MLAVVCSYFNPCNYSCHLSKYRRFRQHLAAVDLFTAELSFDGTFVIEDSIKFSGTANNVMWQKERLLNLLVERLLNLLVERLPDKYDKIAWIDADLLFCNDGWPAAAEAMLDEFHVGQLYSKVHLLNQRSESDRYWNSLCYLRQELPGTDQYPHPGYAWAARREMFPLLDIGVVGSGDFMMACSWEKNAVNPGVNEKWLNAWGKWGGPQYARTAGRMGYVPGDIIHFYHGEEKNRLYRERHQFLIGNDYDPEADIALDDNGLWRWTGAKPVMEGLVRDYFAARKEDE